MRMFLQGNFIIIRVEPIAPRITINYDSYEIVIFHLRLLRCFRENRQKTWLSSRRIGQWESLCGPVRCHHPTRTSHRRKDLSVSRFIVKNLMSLHFFDHNRHSPCSRQMSSNRCLTTCLYRLLRSLLMNCSRVCMLPSTMSNCGSSRNSAACLISYKQEQSRHHTNALSRLSST